VLVSGAAAPNPAGGGGEGQVGAGAAAAAAPSAADLLQEDPQVAERRKRAVLQRNQLLEARRLLNAF
jgi:hypothetical protein